MYSPSSFNFFTTSTRAWKRFMPYNGIWSGVAYFCRGTHLELRPSICVESTIVVQNIDKVKLVPYSNFVIIRIVSRSDLHGTSSKGHINDDIIRHYWNTAVNKRMDGKLAMKVLRRWVNVSSIFWLEKRDVSHFITLIIGMHSDGSVPEHSLWTRGRHYDPFVCVSGPASAWDRLRIKKRSDPSSLWGMQTR
jgi:hypothetical protein